VREDLEWAQQQRVPLLVCQSVQRIHVALLSWCRA
jgi:hypothetical protein